jgi:hypothetical protein
MRRGIKQRGVSKVTLGTRARKESKILGQALAIWSYNGRFGESIKK